MMYMSLQHPRQRGRPPPISFWKLFVFLITLKSCSSLEFSFTNRNYNASIPENAFGNTAVISDEKMGIFLSDPTMNIEYRIVSGDDNQYFKTEARVVGDFCFLEISVRTGNKKVLNREGKSSYILLVKAIQRKRNKVSHEATYTNVSVTITDLNDLSPFFIDSNYEIRLGQDTPLYSSVIKVKAEDPDEGLNGHVYYSFKEQTNTFAIHPTTGVVTLTRLLNYDVQSRYHLTIVARDRGLQTPGSWPPTAKLSINVSTFNSYEPTMKVTMLQEPIPNGHLDLVAIINIHDNDRGPGGKIKTIEIDDGDSDRAFRITQGSDTNEYNLGVLQNFNWALAPYGFNLSVKATDNGSPPRAGYKVIRVLPPPKPYETSVFLQKVFDVGVNEMAPPGTKILAVSSFLPGSKRSVTYSIVDGNRDQLFRIDHYSGVIWTARKIDVDTKHTRTLTISAMSTGIFRRNHQNKADVHITVIDSNDRTPIIVAPQGSVTVEENQIVNSHVTRVRAQDYDVGHNEQVTYSIANHEKVPFNIDPFLGDIRTTEVLDFETQRRVWKLKVRASDWGVPFRRQSEKTIVVEVMDTNDNRPQFEEIDCQGIIYRSSPIGQEIHTLVAIDFDSGNIISYRIVSGNEDRCFNLDSSTGVLSLSCDLQELRTSERTINVTATDGEHFADTMTIHLKIVPHRSSARSYIQLNCKQMHIAEKLAKQISLAAARNPKEEDVNFSLLKKHQPMNANSPRTSNNPIEVRVRENSEPGTSVAKISATDNDSGYEGYLVYAISDGNKDSVFEIDMFTGELSIAGVVDRESTARYSLNISVYDLGDPQRSTSQIVIIGLVDENDNVPEFEKSAYLYFIPESSRNGTSVTQLVAHDPDEGINGVITYSLETDTKDFHLDSVTGKLSVSTILDYETTDIYELRVVATDGGGRSSYAYITIEIFNINDCPPEFPGVESSVKIPEDLPIGSLVAFITAYDRDSPSITYELIGDHKQTFQLDPHTAGLRLMSSLDYETKPIYNITIRATDNHSPSLSGETHFIIEVVDVNENIHAPVFGKDFEEASVKENSPPNTFVVSVPAIDGDVSLNPADSAITYSLVDSDSSGLFYIDQKGDIYTSAWLDRELQKRYWLAVRAQDSGTVPRHATLHVYVEVEDVNDNHPLTEWAVYWPAVPENSPADSFVAKIEATDADDISNTITYRIASGNENSFFKMKDKYSGEITTTSRRLNHEDVNEFSLEIEIKDSDSEDALSSTAYVVIKVQDENDNMPKFLHETYSITVPVGGQNIDNVGQLNEVLSEEGLLVGKESTPFESAFEGSGLGEERLKRSSQSSFYDEEIDFFWEPIATVTAIDEDDGVNAEITYSMEESSWSDVFKINHRTGTIYAKDILVPDSNYKFKVRATDNGSPQLHATCLVIINTVALPPKSANKPEFLSGDYIRTTVFESDPVGSDVQFLNVRDKDADKLWFKITDGNTDDAFVIGRETGNIIIGHKLDCEKQDFYNLTVEVTDGYHVSTCKVGVVIMDSNEHHPIFSKPSYEVTVPENTPVGTSLLTLQAEDADRDSSLSFFMVNSARLNSKWRFTVDSDTGDVILEGALDREFEAKHVLTVGVYDKKSPGKKNYVRVTIHVEDYNDHPPHFLSSLYNATIVETAAMGTRILQVTATDPDKGTNGYVTYSIVSGNIDGTFSIEPQTGQLSLSRPVDRHHISNYWLTIKARDDGSPPKHSLVNVNIRVILPVNSPPRFIEKEYLMEIGESAKVGSYLGAPELESDVAVVYTLETKTSPFVISPSSGLILIDKPLDFEHTTSYNLTVTATSMNGKNATAFVIVNVLDQNDNTPVFQSTHYEGHISEASDIGSVILTIDNEPLVIQATDEDSGINANLVYKILEEEARLYFNIDSATGALRTIDQLDHEVTPEVNLSVVVRDSGKPRLTCPTVAQVRIRISDVNDVPPRFPKPEYHATIYLPTRKGVIVSRLNATDLDFGGNTTLIYAIVSGNTEESFSIESTNGIVIVNNTNLRSRYLLQVSASDGEFSSSTLVDIRTETISQSGLRFAEPKYMINVKENTTIPQRIVMLEVIGSGLSEHLIFSILNPSSLFTIGETSGVIHTTGVPFDRETQFLYELLVQVRSGSDPLRIAHVPVDVFVEDSNDNAPIFVNTPYYAIIPVDLQPQTVVFKVQAADFDIGENRLVKYKIHKGYSDLFHLNRITGEISLIQQLHGVSEYTMTIKAYDQGDPPLWSTVDVHLKVVDRSQPIFTQQFYAATVSESDAPGHPVATITAVSQLEQKLIYIISSGNDYHTFIIGQNDGIIRVDEKLDFESKTSYQLQVRAYDTHSAKYAEVPVSVLVEDVNDNPPTLAQTFYNISVSEATPIATPLHQILSSDRDSSDIVSYSIHGLNGSIPQHFYIDSSSGMIFLKRGLDFETQKSHLFVISASDVGPPSLSSTARILVQVVDMNDNSPVFEQESYRCFISEDSTKGFFVTHLSAYDKDVSDEDRLIYSIVDGNNMQAFNIESTTGTLRVWSQQRLSDRKVHYLNVSVTDGVFTAYARVSISITPTNTHSPQFEYPKYMVAIPENLQPDTFVVSVSAHDEDSGMYGKLTYHLVGSYAQKHLRIVESTGEVWTVEPLDREKTSSLTVTIAAIDIGGRTGFSSLHIDVEDTNDNVAQFTQSNYRTVLPSNATTGSLIITILATDADAESNSHIKYWLHNTTKNEIRSLVDLDENTGEIRLHKDAHHIEDPMEFLVSCTDGGIENEVSTANVFLSVADWDDIPHFRFQQYTFSVLEDTIPGSIIGNVRAKYRGPLAYTITWNENVTPPIGVEDGQLVLRNVLDRETQNHFYIIVTVTPKDLPQFDVSTLVLIEVQDVNDVSPSFESTKYYVSVAENTPVDSNIVKVTAYDGDDGRNRELQYILLTRSSRFNIDPYTGWITLQRSLNAEHTQEYQLKVGALDNGTPQLTAETIVVIQVVDYNDSPPSFQKDLYQNSILEDALPGTVVAEIAATDLDLKESAVEAGYPQSLQYYITGGNTHQSFHIRSGGQVYVARPLDRETVNSYQLHVTVSDGVHIASTELYVKVADVNDHPPICTQPEYHESVLENVSAGTHLLQIQAYDPDSSFRPHFYLSGQGSERFSISSLSGRLSTAVELDREQQDQYDLRVTVVDSDNTNWKCSCQVKIRVDDVNDNAPVFTESVYNAHVPENSPENMLIIKVHATDPDLGHNRKVTYALSNTDMFSIDRHTGILRALRTLDREHKAMYNLSVTASDHGSVKHTSKATVLVLVSDDNDNPPEFANQIYYTTVEESAAVGSEIARVLATSRDTGKNAEISYSIFGGNEHEKFAIHPTSGVLTIIHPLDYERARTYLLNIQAQDGGDVPLSNYAKVNITVTDVNDNSPVFIQSSYSASVYETAPIGERLIQVVATDQDSSDNGHITYAISAGDPHMQFHIDKRTGWVTVRQYLDRESLGSYSLDIIALDQGIPAKSGAVSLYIEVLDANDNAPVFIMLNKTVYVQEDKPPNYVIYKFEVTDADVDKDTNGAPFTYEIRSGNEAATFRISRDGELLVASRLNRMVQELYRLLIRVYDHGKPTLDSETWIDVRVIEESQFPPSMLPLHVTAYIRPETYLGGVIGELKASDQDPYDTLTYGLIPSSELLDSKYFDISPQSGVLSSKGNLNEGFYSLNISVTDGKFTHYENANVEVFEIDDDMIDNALLIQLKGATVEEFLRSYRQTFHRSIKSVLNTRSKDTVIMSIQRLQSSLKKKPRHKMVKKEIIEVLFAVRKSNGYLNPGFIRKHLRNEKKMFELTLGLSVVGIPEDKCKNHVCTNGQCKEIIELSKVVVKASTNILSFVSPQHKHQAICICPQGFDGALCETIVNKCAYQPCASYEKCIPNTSDLGYICKCPQGRVGSTCSKTHLECVGRENTPACYSPKAPISFKGKSSAKYSLGMPFERYFIFSVWFRTLYPRGTLLSMAGPFDYAVLAIVEGVPEFRWELGTGEGKVKVPARVDDGQWHHISLERTANIVFLSLDGQNRHKGVSPGTAEFLNSHTTSLLLGVEVQTIDGREGDPRHGFWGCLDDPRIDDTSLPTSPSPSNSVGSLVKLSHVSEHCYDALKVPELCGKNMCYNGATCYEGECHCDARFLGEFCQFDRNPCASSPCLNNGRCVNEGSSFKCHCNDEAVGERCEFVHCNPNPCLNDGMCEEGLNGPVCKCKGFTGFYCNVDINECEKNPCEGGSKCVNTYGSFKCKCPANLTGLYCDVPAASHFFAVDVTQMIYIGVGLCFVVLIAVIACLVCYCRESKSRQHAQEMQSNHVVLNSKNHSDNHHVYKRNSKMSNIEASQTVRTDMPFNSDPNFVPLNNFDTMRSYGSAGDELEHLPQYSRDFVQNIAKPSHIKNRNPRCGSSRSVAPCFANDNLHSPWRDALAMNLKEAYLDIAKVPNDVKFNHGEYLNLKKLPKSNKNLTGRDDASVLSGASTDDMQGYHWDYSDFPHEPPPPLPNILEISVGEARDSSSFHSNESNESIALRPSRNPRFMPPVEGPVDPGRDMETLPVSGLDDTLASDYDTDLDSRAGFETSALLDRSLDFGADSDASSFVPQPKRYESHPNQYLPHHLTASEAGTIEEHSSLLAPVSKPPLVQTRPKNKYEIEVNRLSLYQDEPEGGYNVGGDVCDIEDSEVNSEFEN